MNTVRAGETRSLRGVFLLFFAGIFALAAGLRLAALPAEFWFDEIWSLEFARSAASPWDVFAGAEHHHDNNHKLNTLFLHFCPADAPWSWYRLQSLVAGLLAVGLAARVAGRRGRVEAVLAAILFATDYWLVLCSAEARGYALAVCFALLAFASLERYLEHGGRAVLGVFWLSVVLGFLSHLTFLHCYLALGLWTVYRFGRQRASAREEVTQLARIHAVPALFFVVLYLTDVRRMQLGGGPALPTHEIVGRLLSLGLGGPPASWLTWPLVLFAAVAAVAGLRLLARAPGHLAVFFAVAVAGSPALFLVKRPPFLFERYFLISFIFFLLLLSFTLGGAWRSSRAGKILVVAVMLFICGGSVWQVRDFVRGGRGRFLEALAYLEEQTPGPVVTLAGDYDFRVEKFAAFYVPYLHGSKPFVYLRQDALPSEGARWLLVHRVDDQHPVHPRMRDANDNEYERVQDFRTGVFGGWDWYVYRNRRANAPCVTSGREQPSGADVAAAKGTPAAGPASSR